MVVKKIRTGKNKGRYGIFNTKASKRPKPRTFKYKANAKKHQKKLRKVFPGIEK